MEEFLGVRLGINQLGRRSRKQAHARRADVMLLLLVAVDVLLQLSVPGRLRVVF